MSGGGPPHHPHNRHVPPANAAWNHLPVPNYFPRQPQVAHMQAEHPLLHQASWHTPTPTDGMKMMPHSQMINEMFKSEGLFPRDCVDLSLTRNGNQNGELPNPTAISLSVRDTSKINSLPPSMLDIQAMELTKCGSPNLKSAISPGSIRSSSMSPGLKTTSPGLLSSGPAMKSLSPSGRKSLSPGPKSSSPGLNLAGVFPTASVTISPSDIAKIQKRSNIRVDSILERLNPPPEKTFPFHEIKQDQPLSTIVSTTEKSQTDKPSSQSQSVIVSAATSYDENSNSSGTTNVPTPKEEDSASMHSNEDSLDSTKSRRKRKPNKTVRVNKEDETKSEGRVSPEMILTDFQTTNHKEESTEELTSHPSDPAVIATILEGTVAKLPDRIDLTEDEVDGDDAPPAKTRRKASSESETIDNIAAMVQEGLKEKERRTEGEDEGKLEDAVVKPLEPEMENEDIEPEITPVLSETPEVNTEVEVVSASLIDKENPEYDKEESVSQPDSVDTIDGLYTQQNDSPEHLTSQPMPNTTKPVTVSVIKTKEILEDTLSSGHDARSDGPATTESAPASAQPSAPPLITPAQKKASITHFVEVENKLEEMFAGIVEEDHVEATAAGAALEPLKNDSTLGLTDDSFIKLDDSAVATKKEAEVSEDTKPPQEEPSSFPKQELGKEELEEKKSAVKKTRRNRPLSKREGDLDGEVPSKKKRLTKTKSIGTPSKKPPRSPAGVATKSPKKTSPVTSNKSPTKTSSLDVAKDIFAYDSGSNASSSKSRGPFVQIRGPRDSPLSVSVVNTPLTGDEEGERKSTKNKKFHDDSEYRHKVRSKGLHCSTLSTKYDAERKDTSWICAFCKRGPHASELTGPSVITEVPPSGDLFGPYFIMTQCPEFEKRLDDPYDRQFKSRKITKVLDAATAATTSTKSNNKKKRKLESSVNAADIHLGITDTGNNTFEVWVHEDCMVWSSGVYLVGPKIAGLEEAVWTCSNMPCAGCGLRGANVTCVKRGCLGTTHVCCARKAHWHLDEVDFKAYCPEHSR